jgi:asparagine synthase (glutamine-hydrolysing)
VCGIAGLLALNSNVNINPELLDSMTDVMAHRGPDGRGVWFGDGVAFGHRRLAVLDPERGVQPWVDEFSGISLTYNGELYNYLELREELRLEGANFRSECDTEVVLRALQYWGVEKSLSKFRGMFAFGYWEAGPRRLTIARDPIGVKPLYWAMRGGLVRFGSEIKAILADSSFPRSVDTTTMMNYLAHYRLNFNKNSLFRHINEVGAGCYVQWEGKRRTEKKYWSLACIPESEKTDLGEEKTAELFKEHLTKAVSRRLIADVPVGAYLSGGIDSAVLVSIMKKLGHPDLRTYSIGFAEDGFNEFSYSQQMAKQINVQHHQVTQTEEGYFNEFESLIGIKDTPLSVPNEVPLRFLSRHLKHRITVVLSGEGADEILGGYQFLSRSPHDYLLAKALKENSGTWSGQERERLESALTGLYGNIDITNQRDQFLRLYQWVPKEQRQNFISSELRESGAENEISAHWDEVWARLDSSGLDPYEKVLHILEEQHLSALLLRLDATTMAEGVEGRVPYTDLDLVEWVNALPLHYKIRWKGEKEALESQKVTALEAAGRLDISKYLLRLAYAGDIPDDILLRPKTAFPVPMDEWFFGARHGWAKERILTQKMSRYFDLQSLEKFLATSRAKGEGMKVWMLTNIGIWLDQYM